VTDWFSYLH